MADGDDQLRALDIPDKQVILHREDDADCPYHHVVILHRIAEGRWIVLTHNDRGEVVRRREDLDELSYAVIRRGAAFPPHTVDDGLLYLSSLGKLAPHHVRHTVGKFVDSFGT